MLRTEMPMRELTIPMAPEDMASAATCKRRAARVETAAPNRTGMQSRAPSAEPLSLESSTAHAMGQACERTVLTAAISGLAISTPSSSNAPPDRKATAPRGG